MAKRFFDPEGLLWKPLGFIGDLVAASLLWGLCSIPLVTIGPATTALYDTVVHAMRRKDDALFSRFFATLRRELKTGAITTLLWAAIAALLYGLYRLLLLLPPAPMRNTVATLFVVLVPFFLLMILCWVFPTLSRFTFSVAALNAASLRLALGNILRSLLLALITAAGILACALFTSPLIFVPGLTALLWSYLIEPVFLPFEKREEE